MDSGRKEFISKLINTDEYDKYCNWMNTDSPVYIYVRLILTRTELYKILIDELNAGWDGQSVDLLNINKELDLNGIKFNLNFKWKRQIC